MLAAFTRSAFHGRWKLFAWNAEYAALQHIPCQYVVNPYSCLTPGSDCSHNQPGKMNPIVNGPSA